MTNPPQLSQQELDDLFPKQRLQPIKPGVFEIGLCLGGTVSAGAYTGGVLDCLIEVYGRAVPNIGDRDVAAILEYFETSRSS